MYKGGRLTICDRLTQIKESIYYIQQWSKEINCADDFLASMDKVMVFNACVMRLQVIGAHNMQFVFFRLAVAAQDQFYLTHIRFFIWW